MPLYFQNFRVSLSWNRQLLSLIILPENTFKNESPIDEGLYPSLHLSRFWSLGNQIASLLLFSMMNWTISVSTSQSRSWDVDGFYRPIEFCNYRRRLFTLADTADIGLRAPISLSLSILVCFVLLPDHEVEKDPQLVSMVSQKLSILEPLPYFILMRGVI